MHSVDLLIEALEKYEGSFILVSHDRYFVSKTANKIWQIVDGKIVEFRGGYDEWVEWTERMAKKAQTEARAQKEQLLGNTNKKADAPAKKSADDGGVPSSPKNNAGPTAGQQPVIKSAPIDKEKQKEQRKLQKQFEELEQQITRLQEEKKTLEAKLAAPEIYSDHKKFAETERQYNDLSKKLSEAESAYEEVFGKLF